MTLIGFDVDVAGALACGLAEQSVEQTDDGRVIRGFEQVFHGRQLLQQAAQIGIVFDFAGDSGRRRIAERISLRDALAQRGRFQLLRLRAEPLGCCPAHGFAPRTGLGLAGKVQRATRSIALHQQMMAASEAVGQGVALAQGLRSGAGGSVMLFSTVMGPLAGT
jgi:hypothetical protein